MVGISNKTVEFSVLALSFLSKKDTGLPFVTSHPVDSSPLHGSANATLCFFLCADFSRLMLSRKNF